MYCYYINQSKYKLIQKEGIVLNDINLKYTGNPFVDAGLSAICSWYDIEPEQVTKEHIIKLIDIIADLYTKKKSDKKQKSWLKDTYTMFTGNSHLNHPSKTKNDTNSIHYKEQLLYSLEQFDKENKNNQLCLCCGRYPYAEVKYVKKKSEYGLVLGTLLPMVSSTSNYYPSGKVGSHLCPLCLILAQFSLMIMMKCKGALTLLHSNNKKIMKYWADIGVEYVRYDRSTRAFNGCRDEHYNNPKNALFHTITEILRKNEDEFESDNQETTVRLYLFDNYQNSSSPDKIFEFYDLPSNVFRFIRIANGKRYYDEWKKISSNRRFMKPFQKSKSKKNTLTEEEQKEKHLKNTYNYVIEGLLSDKVIIKYFIDWKKKKARSSWNLMKLYLKEVLEMDKKRIDAIRTLGAKLAEIIQKQNLKKLLRNLENVGRFAEFRNQLRLVWKKQMETGEKEPLFAFDDYVNYLFPDAEYISWRDTRDLLVFKMFEDLQKSGWIIESGYVKEYSADEEIEEIKTDGKKELQNG